MYGVVTHLYGAVTLALAFREGVPVNCDGLDPDWCYEAADYVTRKVVALRDKVNKTTILTEVGWPSKGEKCCTETPEGFPEDQLWLAEATPKNANDMLHKVGAGWLAGWLGAEAVAGC